MKLGTAITTEDGPSISGFSFVIEENAKVKRGQFVAVKTNEGTAIATVSNILKTNRYFESAGSVREYNKTSDIFTAFPVKEWEYTVADAKLLGTYTPDGMLNRPSFPPSPGTEVSEVETEMLNKFLGLDQEKGIDLGEIQQHELRAKLNMTKMLQKHLAVLAISGAGKSYAVAVLIEELLSRTEKQGKIAILIIDNHGEYVGLAEDQTFRDKISIINGEEIKIGLQNISEKVFAQLLPSMTAVQVREIGKIMAQLKKEGPFDIADIIDAVKLSDNLTEPTANALLAWLSELKYMDIFHDSDYPDFDNLVEQGKATIINFHDVLDLRKKQLIVQYVSRKLFNLRRKNLVPPYLEIIEEAHNFCLSEDTEILTANGWKKYDEIKVGDMIFSYDKEKNKIEHNPIERIIIKKHAGNMIKLNNQDSISALTTEDHRVLCRIRTTNNKTRKWKWSEPRFVFAKDLPTGFKIPVSAEMTSKFKCGIDNDLIKIIGWIITDGYLHFYDNKKYSSYEISQAKSKGTILEEMRTIISRRFPESTIYSRIRQGNRFPDKKYATKTEEFTFHLGKKATDEIKNWLAVATHRIPRKILETASLSQLKLLFDALVQGDGTIYRGKNYLRIVFYSGHDSLLADDFQELCVRLGLSAVKTKWAYGQTNVAVSFKRKFAHVRKITTEHYAGKVWDITVKTGAFVARRKGKCFITGNCPEGAKSENAISRGVIELLAREGRKFYANLCLISQRPVQLSTTALSQCNTQMILRVTNPYDLDHIKKSAEAISSSTLDIISSLKVGEALIIGEAVNYPVFIKIRKRKSKESHGTKLEDYAILWEKKAANNKLADAKEFL